MGLQIGQIMDPSYSWGMVLFSFLIACSGSLVGLLCAERMVRRNGSFDLAMLVCGAVALGGIGIWSMHFIGMVAYRLPVPIAYDLPLTAASLLAAILICALSLFLAGSGRRRFSNGGWIAGSILAGLGVCVMHYMGMYAMNMRAEMHWDLTRVGVSMGIAIVAAAAALWLAFNLRHTAHQLAASVVMGLAVCSMHYVGMSAATMVCVARAPQSVMTLSGAYLGLMVFGVAGVVLILIGWMVSERSVNTPDFHNTAMAA